MRKIIRETAKLFLENNDDDRKLSAYYALRDQPGWEVHVEILSIIRYKMAHEVLSERFTQLSKEDKDTHQRAYAHVDELIKFLINPLAKSMKRQQFKYAFDQKMGTGVKNGRG